MRLSVFAAAALLLGLAPIACHKEEQAVVGAAKTAVTAEEKAQAEAQAEAAQRDQQRAALDHIPLPTKSLYVDVHDASAWTNPFISVDVNTLDLRVIMADANPSSMGKGTLLRPQGARRQELTLRQSDLVKALIALPAGAWHYGRVVAVAESPQANAKNRPQIRRNVEAVIKQLNDIGIVVEEWPTH